MDPNLEKIIARNYSNISSGFLGCTLAQARSYLTYVLLGNRLEIDREFEQFKSHIQSISNQAK